ncbi:YgfZ/GcvT domain-containing protein [Microbacterium sp. R86528]|uniref:CAF17-like 4Fe-4S cluster assembly/insertion protein YgfZ n=1 Tax=Microbacterium sp. R86528 TaxID=3093864 RepID=UPI0037CC4CA4
MDAAFRTLDGAVTDDRGLVHLGNPLSEQRSLARGTSIAPLADRSVLAVTGEDRLSWLDSLTSQALNALAPGESTELLVLDPHGHIEHAASVIDDGATAWLIVEKNGAQALATWLTRMRFRLRVEVRDASEEYSVFGASRSGAKLVTAAEPAGVPLVWVDPWPAVSVGGWAYAVAEPHPGSARDWVEVIATHGEAKRVAAAAAAGDIAISGLAAVDALRVAAWRPRWLRETDERTLPHEVDWLRTAVHLSKGCYRGQETVAKVHNLGHPPRRLVALQLDGSDSTLPAVGADVLKGETVVGSITSVALHYEDGPIALALVKRTTPIEEVLLVQTDDGVITAAQEIIVPPEAGATAGVPRMPRLSRRTRAT